MIWGYLHGRGRSDGEGGHHLCGLLIPAAARALPGNRGGVVGRGEGGSRARYAAASLAASRRVGAGIRSGQARREWENGSEERRFPSRVLPHRQAGESSGWLV